MDYITHIFYGFVMAYIGLIAPGMLNMTAVRTSIENGRMSGVKFSAGAASVVFVQASIALVFANYLNKSPDILEKLKLAGVFVFVSLAVFFFLQAKKKFKAEGKQKKGKYFLTGMLMSSMNMLAIPFYLGLSSFLEAKGLLILKQPYISIFVLGAVLGAFSLFSTYSYFAELVAKKAQFIAKNINYILSILFVVLSITTLAKVLDF
jgi:threonine/homoserine/homoserine lactone efflux protein